MFTLLGSRLVAQRCALPGFAFVHLRRASSLKVFNSLSGRKEPMIASGAEPLTWYSCGPTVYDSAHLGHGRTYVSFDIVRRILTDYLRVPVVLAMGVTDIDDKIIARAAAAHVDFRHWARFFEADFFSDMNLLDVRAPDMFLRVSEHMPDIVAFISRLETLGMVYRGDKTGSIYFDSRAFAAAGHTLHKLRTSLRTREPDAPIADTDDSAADSTVSTEKRDSQDFVLWKVRRARDWRPAATSEIQPPNQWHDSFSDPVWPSPWGFGRPGWHIECSAHIQSAFGNSLAIHSGGIDLQFPHHDNEIHQCDAHCNTPGQVWCQFFMHTGHLYIKGKKMSKSLKNFISIQDFFAAGHSKEQFRMMCLLQHYRASMDYSDDLLSASTALLGKFHAFFDTVTHHLQKANTEIQQSVPVIDKALIDLARGVASGAVPERAPAIHMALSSPSRRRRPDDVALAAVLSTCQTSVDAALRDDFDTPAVFRALQHLVSACHLHFRASSLAINVELIASIVHFIARTLDLFGLASFSKYCALSPLTHQQLPSHTAARALPQSEIDVARLVQELVQFRSLVRASAIQLGKADSATTRKTLLDACDSLRDGSLVDLGVWLKDGKDGVAEFQILGADGAKERQRLLIASSKHSKVPK